MKDEYRLREATTSDFDALYDIYMDARVNPYLGFEIMSKDMFQPIFEQRMQMGKTVVYEINNLVIASAIIVRHHGRQDHVVTLRGVVVHPRYHGKGIGTKFLTLLIATLQQSGVKRISLCVEADNPGAKHLYQKLGFKEEGILRQTFKRANEDTYIDDHMMALLFD